MTSFNPQKLPRVTLYLSFMFYVFISRMSITLLVLFCKISRLHLTISKIMAALAQTQVGTGCAAASLYYRLQIKLRILMTRYNFVSGTRKLPNGNGKIIMLSYYLILLRTTNGTSANEQ